jgi:hypothetical protein
MQEALEWTATLVHEQYVRPTFDELGTLEMLLDELRDNGALYHHDGDALTALTSKHKALFTAVGLPTNAFRAAGSSLTEFDWLYWKAKLAMLRAAIEYLE